MRRPGAGTTQIAMFAEGHLLLCDVIPVGGNHVTFDIARALGTTLPEAERIKRCYGTLLGTMDELGEVFTYSSRPWADHMDDSSGPAGEVRTARAARGGSAVADRCAQDEPVRAHCRASRALKPAAICASHDGADRRREPASRHRGRRCRLLQAASGPGHRARVSGLSAGFCGPHMAAVAGLALAPPGYHVRSSSSAPEAEEQGYLRRVGGGCVAVSVGAGKARRRMRARAARADTYRIRRSRS